jgi:hypothetical protein
LDTRQVVDFSVGNISENSNYEKFNPYNDISGVLLLGGTQAHYPGNRIIKAEDGLAPCNNPFLSSANACEF